MKRLLSVLILILLKVNNCLAVPEDCLPDLSGNLRLSMQNSSYCDIIFKGRNGDCNENYIGIDSNIGLASSYCKNTFPTLNERFLLKRQGDQQPDLSYLVIRNYCYFRDINGKCSSGWTDQYSATFGAGEVSQLDGSSNTKKILTSGGGLLGYHVCLIRVPPEQKYPHYLDNSQAINTSQYNQVCAYEMNATASQNCQSPVISYKNALIGCVDEPLFPDPITFNEVMPSLLKPILRVTWLNANSGGEQGLLSYGSTFDQPVIALSSSSIAKGDKLLLLRYKFPESGRNIDNLPQCGNFPAETNIPTTWCAKMHPQQQDKICACVQGKECDDNLFLGCVDRPTPRQSNLSIVAVSSSIPDQDGKIVPQVRLALVKTNPNGTFMYVDENNNPVVRNISGNFVRQADGSIPAMVNYNEVPIQPIAMTRIKEFMAVPHPSAPQSQVKLYVQDSRKIFGLDFTAIIPALDASNNPEQLVIDNPYVHSFTDGCQIFTVDPLNTQFKPKYTLPAGDPADRDRTYCICPNGVDPGLCPIFSAKGVCYDGQYRDSDPDALFAVCPGIYKPKLPNETQDKICLQLKSSWDKFFSPNDKLCASIYLPNNSPEF
jgi:hypothetical protein